jgi:hypothetical protein
VTKFECDEPAFFATTEAGSHPVAIFCGGVVLWVSGLDDRVYDFLLCSSTHNRGIVIDFKRCEGISVCHRHFPMPAVTIEDRHRKHPDSSFPYRSGSDPRLRLRCSRSAGYNWGGRQGRTRDRRHISFRGEGYRRARRHDHHSAR